MTYEVVLDNSKMLINCFEEAPEVYLYVNSNNLVSVRIDPTTPVVTSVDLSGSDPSRFAPITVDLSTLYFVRPGAGGLWKANTDLSGATTVAVLPGGTDSWYPQLLMRGGSLWLLRRSDAWTGYNMTLHHLSTDGTVLSTDPLTSYPTGSSYTADWEPSDMGCASDGTLFIVGHHASMSNAPTVVYYDVAAEAAIETHVLADSSGSWTSTSSYQKLSVAVSPADDNLFVSFKGFQHIRRYSPTGTLLNTYTWPAGVISWWLHQTVSPDGQYLYAVNLEEDVKIAWWKVDGSASGTIITSGAVEPWSIIAV